MKSSKYFSAKEIIKIVLIAFGILLFICLSILKSNVEFAEWWTRNFGFLYENIIGRISSLFPISMLEFWIIFLIGIVIFFFVIMIINFKRKNKSKGIKSITAIILVAVCTISIFQATYGVSYNRKKVDIVQYEEKIDYTYYDEIISYYLEDFNFVSSQMQYKKDGDVISPYSFEELSSIMQEEYKRLDSDYFNSYTPKTKKMYLTSWLYTELWIQGVFFAPSGDANINYKIPASNLPYTIGHELAHAKGVTREDDANLTSLYINLTSDKPYLRYSAYMNTFYSILQLSNYMGDDEAYSKYNSMLNSAIGYNHLRNNEFWNSHTVINDIGEWFNNLYLKLNGTSGTGSYDDVYDVGDGIKKDDETGEEVQIKIVSNYSPYQKLYFALYPYELN